MGHVRKELGFELIKLAQLLGDAALLFVETGVFQGCGGRVGQSQGQVKLIGGEGALLVEGA